ncbi:MAG: aldo/keto reductase [SAR202 cluster bacterium]|nr:aldo/keto reductase [SAR202 cluster bacterium]
MQYRQLGSSDLKVSVVGLGGNVYGPPRLTQEQTVASLNHAIEKGINFLDTAIGYGEGQSEVFIGNALQGKRDKMLIATKFVVRNRKEGVSVQDHILAQADESLRKLRTDHIDLYQIHQPDPAVPEEPIMEALAKLVQAGKVRWTGECNYAAWRHAVSNAIAEKNGWPKMVSSQNHYNVLRRHVELEILPYCERFNIGFLPYFPLAGGFLTGKYQPGQPPPPGSRGAEGSGIIAKARNAGNEAVLAKLEAYCKERGHTVLELAVSWLLAHKAIPSVIAGTSSAAQIDANIASAGWKITPEEMAEIDRIAAWDGTNETVDGSQPGQFGARAGLNRQQQGAQAAR